VRIKTPIKYPGGKSYLAGRIAELMKDKPHICYIEPYCGGCSVLFARDPDFNWSHDPKQPGCSEVINDYYEALMTFWKVVADPNKFKILRQNLELTLFGQDSFTAAYDLLRSSYTDPIVIATAFFIVNRQSRSGSGKMFITPVVNRTRKGINDHVSAYLSAIEGLTEAHARLKTVVITNQDAMYFVNKYKDNPNVLMYLDPPYPLSTRTTTQLYERELTDDEHYTLIDAIRDAEAGVILSSYDNSIYNEGLTDWNRLNIPVKKHMSGKKAKPEAVEVVWYNF